MQGKHWAKDYISFLTIDYQLLAIVTSHKIEKVFLWRR
jgi:hypothetical protein